jgi:hypothetical protein
MKYILPERKNIIILCLFMTFFKLACCLWNYASNFPGVFKVLNEEGSKKINNIFRSEFRRNSSDGYQSPDELNP